MPARDSLLLNLRLWWRRNSVGRKFAFALAGAAVLSGIATVSTMTGWQGTPDPDPDTVLILLYLDAILLLMLVVVVARRLVMIWSERRRGQAGSGLHTRLVVMFALVAATPAILVAVFSVLFLNFGIQTWFSERVRTALEASNAVAVSYLHEHQQNIRADALATANDLNAVASELTKNPRGFNNYLSKQAGIRSFLEALVIDSTGKVLARTPFSQSLEFELVPPEILTEASLGKVVVMTTETDDRVRAVVRLNRFVDAYLLIGRFVDPQVLDHIDNTRGAVLKYKQLEKEQGGLQVTFVMIYGVVALLLLLAAMWIGLTLAGQLSRPISGLITASERVRKGDLGVRVGETTGTDELGMLGRAFNRMTSTMEEQQLGLMEANRLIDERRRFTETVLSGVSAGVIGLDDTGKIHLPNRTASEFLGHDLEKSAGEYLGIVVPEMAALLDKCVARPDRLHSDEIQITRSGQPHTLHVNIAAERMADEILGFVVTFDDVTELLSAQRKAAWADVARRIAHEIKNPLTPIQLSAERLKRKYLKQITDDPETFAACTETIVRQVEDIGRMVDEFSSFARMPQASLEDENLSDICMKAVMMERHRQPDIEYATTLPESDIRMNCDNRQISQALTNLMKNAAESVTARMQHADSSSFKGSITCSLSEEVQSDGGAVIRIVIEDNGIGLPDEQRNRLTEPYVTSREGGTGLGLAIVKKIMEDHNGEIIMDDRGKGGAIITLVFHLVDLPEENIGEELIHGS
ncbi:MAG: PAS domain-containing sensor histidine kinase [Rhodospirillaceae bacterium]|nr:PAS domain-containing sensor histidine kinase [Rhodospirillaceae bacterium]MBT4220365.1 PAS domain-containing sensor histidine kinase [Rhodospirillaceae bacterium]MBT4464592.1 PAS domain-containing sensor histidine kinase [Rhodospirillaceae bacterium]MBT5014122.1 PAS domain-containing sensor histidine kinase [Rhodospirillaceae bacterium]MBT5309287.1 PAS domain-containing sensor histidine kinase [Rhodospirillaceae bacterium]